jgi:hypothetical protein
MQAIAARRLAEPLAVVGRQALRAARGPRAVPGIVSKDENASQLQK